VERRDDKDDGRDDNKDDGRDEEDGGETRTRRRADESPQLIPTPGNGRPPRGCDEWAQRRKVAPNDDIREGRRVHTRGHNDSHPALDETTTTPHSTID